MAFYMNKNKVIPRPSPTKRKMASTVTWQGN